MGFGVDINQRLAQGLQLSAVQGRQLRALGEQQIDLFDGLGLILSKPAPKPVVRRGAVEGAPAVDLRLAQGGTVHAGNGHAQLRFERQAVAAVFGIVIGKSLEQRGAVEPLQMIGGALVLDRIGLGDGRIKLRHEGLQPRFVDRRRVAFRPAVLARELDVVPLLALLVGGVAETAVAAHRRRDHVDVAAGVLAVGVPHAKRVGVVDVALLGLFGEGELEVFEAEGDGVFALVVDAFAVGFAHEGFERLHALIAPGIELLGDADRIVQHHGKTLRLGRRCAKPRSHTRQGRVAGRGRKQLLAKVGHQGRGSRPEQVGDATVQRLGLDDVCGVAAALDQLADIDLAQGVAQPRLRADLGEQARRQQVRGEQQPGFVDVFRIADLDDPIAEVRQAAQPQLVRGGRPYGLAQAAAVGLIGALAYPVGRGAVDEHIQIPLAQCAHGIARGGQGQAGEGLRPGQGRRQGRIGVPDHGIAQRQQGHRAFTADAGTVAFGAERLPGHEVEQVGRGGHGRAPWRNNWPRRPSPRALRCSAACQWAVPCKRWGVCWRVRMMKSVRL
ncbi:hypothetical protein D3C71_1136140 [compost metagenome]